MGRCTIQLVMVSSTCSGKNFQWIDACADLPSACLFRALRVQESPHIATLCNNMPKLWEIGPRKRTIHVANLDPAAENFGYQLAFDICDLISVEEVMEELKLGPNGGLVYCMEYLLNNLDWLQDALDDFGDDDYLILDCPGQLELYTHIPLMRNVIDRMRMWGYESSMIGVFCIDTTFVSDTSKFISGSLLSLSAMIALELPHVNILTKCDMISEEDVELILNRETASEIWG